MIPISNKDEDKIDFNATVFRAGGSLVFAIPPKIIEYLELEEGDTVELQAENGPKGRYSSFWNAEHGDKSGED